LDILEQRKIQPNQIEDWRKTKQKRRKEEISMKREGF
jgi:hypothetical protein